MEHHGALTFCLDLQSVRLQPVRVALRAERSGVQRKTGVLTLTCAARRGLIYFGHVLRRARMKGWVAGPELVDDLPEPSGDVVAVRATSVNSIDTRTSEGVLGWDFAGPTENGAAVFGFARGAWAERITAGAFVAPKPDSLSMAEAGAVGAAGTFALAYIEALELSGGERVLVVGANGGAGSIAVQLCVALGCTVVAPALEIDEAFLRGLGVTEVVAREERPAADAVIDFVRPAAGVSAMDDPGRVARLGALIDEHSIRVPICEAFTFGQLEDALEAFGEHKQGKLSVA